jgi:hypothetical protein
MHLALPPQLERYPAGSDDLYPGTPAKEIRHDVGGAYDVLKVVEKKQRSAMSKDTFQLVDERRVRSFDNT